LVETVLQLIEMNYIFLGCTKFSGEILNHLISIERNPAAVFTIPEEFTISYSEEKVKNSNFFDFNPICQEMDVPLFEVDSAPGKSISDYAEVISEIQPDVILVMGWYYMVPKSIRNLSKHGAWGIHASLLPDYAGGAPLVWAMINGEKKTGVSLFQLDSGVDDGDIIAQKEIQIDENDHIRHVYMKATEASKTILSEALSNLKNISYRKQNKDEIKVYPQRRPSDGEIDWSKSTEEITDFIRAQSKPYPGAFFIHQGKKVTIWDATIEDFKK
jgi:methionyl-tRNA formyltransferase